MLMLVALGALPIVHVFAHGEQQVLEAGRILLSGHERWLSLFLFHDIGMVTIEPRVEVPTKYDRVALCMLGFLHSRRNVCSPDFGFCRKAHVGVEKADSDIRGALSGSEHLQVNSLSALRGSFCVIDVTPLPM